jgi:predicted nuclease of predicted toxin-antitoxin system
MKILVDECLPLWLPRQLSGHDVKTVQQMGWSALKDSEILNRAESQFQVFLTADKNLKHQHNLKGHILAIIVLPSNRLSIVKGLLPAIRAALLNVQLGTPEQYIELGGQ